MPTGKVARYFDDCRYGFIAPHDGGRDVFFHCSELPENKPPKRGAPVQFEIADGAKGKRAVQIAFLETTQVKQAICSARGMRKLGRSPADGQSKHGLPLLAP